MLFPLLIFFDAGIFEESFRSFKHHKKSEGVSLQRKYDVTTVKPSYKQYISIVATDDLKAKIEKTVQKRLFNNLIYCEHRIKSE